MPARFFPCRLWAFALLVACTGFLFSCQTGQAPTGSHLNQQTITLLKSFVQTTVETRDRKRSLRQVLLVRGSQALRVDTLSLLGQPLGVYIFDGQKLKGQRSVLYDTRRNRVFQGIEVREMLGKTLGIQLNLEEYVRVFAGNIPRLETLKMTGGTLNQEGTTYQLTGIDPEDKSRMEIEIDAYTLLPVKVKRTLRDGKVIHIQWQDYRLIEGQEFPHRIAIEFPAEKAGLTLVFSEPVLNAGIPDESFKLPFDAKNISALRN